MTDSANEFLTLLIAAMTDAGETGHCTQLQSQIMVPGKGIKIVRLIVVPEEMELVRAKPGDEFKRPA